ncbi:MAG: hypothetical protein DRQ64_08860 [Gammaproteobacteria bacterium]|nr:MAG: hypothetical protein DRQ64_08860 [Gammaproteobacteria bacterium]
MDFAGIISIVVICIIIWGMSRIRSPRTVVDAQSVGKKVADTLGIEHNLFFSSLEQVMPTYLEMLALMERQGMEQADVCVVCIPLLSEGLDALEERFGSQAAITDARDKLRLHVSDS